MPSIQLRGVSVMLLTVLIWGATFPVAKVALQALDVFWMSSLRYGLAAPVLVAILCWREGYGALAYRGRFRSAALFGVMGFTGFSFLTFGGLALSRPEHAAIIMALQTPMTAFAHWVLKGVRPANFTMACVAVTIFGVLLVVTKGDPAHAVAGGSLAGDALIFLGAISWVVYTLGAVSFPGWSALRYTTLTALPGTAGIWAVTALAAAAGASASPAPAQVGSVAWELVYLGLLTIVLAVLLWNLAVGYLGALNAMLLGNLVPVVTFGIRILQGARFEPIEFAGAGLVVAALVANNLYVRTRSESAVPRG